MGDEDWGELDDLKDSKKQPLALGLKDPTERTSEKKRQELFFANGADEELDGLEDLPEIGSSFPDNKNEDKFNMLVSSKENGGMLASLGIHKDAVHDESLGEDSEGDPHKKSDLFDTSKDRGALGGGLDLGKQSDDEDFDGFDLGRKDDGSS